MIPDLEGDWALVRSKGRPEKTIREMQDLALLDLEPDWKMLSPGWIRKCCQIWFDRRFVPLIEKMNQQATKDIQAAEDARVFGVLGVLDRQLAL